MYKTLLHTPLGQMIAIGDDKVLHLLEFIDRKNLVIDETIAEGRTPPLDSIERELDLYFKGKLLEFKTPIILAGTPFQQSVWKQLLKIPLGQTRSYGDLAKLLGKPTAFRAVAQANGANQLALIIPCHRVIYTTGGLGGYAAGTSRKQRLLEHEKTIRS